MMASPDLENPTRPPWTIGHQVIFRKPVPDQFRIRQQVLEVPAVCVLEHPVSKVSPSGGLDMYHRSTLIPGRRCPVRLLTQPNREDPVAARTRNARGRP